MLVASAFYMNNRVSPLIAPPGMIRVATNGRHVGHGRFAKRKGIRDAVTIDLKVGSTAPFALVTWRVTTFVVWANSTAYSIGATLQDSTTGAYYTLTHAYTSSPPTTTFAYDRDPITGNPTWFTLVSAPPALTLLVAVGADAAAIVNPWNCYLYEMSPTYTTGKIWRWNVATQAITAVDTFGLSAPTTSGATSEASQGSALAAGQYAFAATSFDEKRLCESPPLFFPVAGAAAWATTTTYNALTAIQDMVANTIWTYLGIVGEPTLDPYASYTSGSGTFAADRAAHPSRFLFVGYAPLLQPLSGPGYSITVPVLTAKDGTNASHAYYYRDRVLSVRNGSPTLTAIPTGSFSTLRFINKNTDGGTWTDSGGQPDRSRLLDYCYDVIPYSTRATWFDGMVLWGRCQLADQQFQLFHSNPRCPETYAGNDKCTLLETQGGNVVGKAILTFTPECGQFVGFATMGEVCLALCESGAWPIHPSATRGLYGVSNDRLWIGCASRATVAYSPYGVWWLAKEGIVLWDPGKGPPTVLTWQIIDPADSSTLFSSDLSGAMGAYDAANDEYVCIIPKSGGGQFALTVRGRMLPDQVAMSVWTFGSTLPTITGIGYDTANQRMVYIFGTSSMTAKTHSTAANVCQDYDTANTTASSYAFGVEGYWVEPAQGANPHQHQAAMIVYVHRADPTRDVALVAQVQGLDSTELRTFDSDTAVTWANSTLYGIGNVLTDPADGTVWRVNNAYTSSASPHLFAYDRDPVTGHPTWFTSRTSGSIAETLPSATLAGYDDDSVTFGAVNLHGRIVRWTITNTDAYPLELRTVLVGEQKDIAKQTGVH